MAEAPMMPFYTDAYMGDTQHLTTLEHGAYFLLLISMWRKGGWLPNDEKLLARYCKMRPAQFKKVWPILEPFFVVEETKLCHGKITDVLQSVRERSKKAADSARAKHRKNKETTPAVAPKTQSERRANAGKTQSESDANAVLTIIQEPEPPLIPPFEEFWKAYPKRKPDNPKTPAEKKFATKVKNGAKPGEIITGAKNYAAAMRAAGNVGTEYVAMATTWLNAERWREYQEAPKEAPERQLTTFAKYGL
jgi:uncharacterized protein YdaU (DUF1376 family)